MTGDIDPMVVTVNNRADLTCWTEARQARRPLILIHPRRRWAKIVWDADTVYPTYVDGKALEPFWDTLSATIRAEGTSPRAMFAGGGEYGFIDGIPIDAAPAVAETIAAFWRENLRIVDFNA